MPSQLLHTLFGEDVIAGIYRRLENRFGIVAGKAFEKIEREYKKAFVLGCQGPDIFYHNRRTRPVGLEYGTLLHRRGAGIFTAGLLRMGLPDPPPDEDDIRAGRREKGINALGAYALGFMTHAVLDRHAHPFIVYKSDRFSPSRPENLRSANSHAFFERIIDTLMFRHLRGAEISGWDQRGILAETCENPPPGLRELLARALVFAFPERAGKDGKLGLRIENTFRDCAFFYRISSPGYVPAEDGLSLRRDHLTYLYPVELPGRIDFLNLEKRPWYSPAGEAKEDTRSFPEIYEGAVKAAADSFTGIISRYLEEGYFPIKEAAQTIGNGGLSLVDENGKPCAPCRASPLPLDEVLEEQARLRGL